MEREKKWAESWRLIQLLKDVQVNPKIIAMKGHPCTGKSFVAKEMAKTLTCALISQDDVLDSFHNLSLQVTSQDFPTEYLVEQSFDTVCQLTMNQLKFGTDRLIIDSPLTCRAHLDRLLQISGSTGVPLVVVECKPKDRYQWRLWVGNESRWGDILEDVLLKEKQGCDYDVGLVPKIMLDTTRDYDTKILLGQIDLLAAFYCDYSVTNCFDYHTFFRSAQNCIGYVENGVIKLDGDPKEFFGHLTCPHTHLQFAFHNSWKMGRTCKSCQTPITPGSSSYFGPECNFSLHKICAELPNKKEIRPRDHPCFLREALDGKYIFREEAQCAYCRSYERGFVIGECRYCLLESYVRSAELPVVLQHPCHDHLLQVKICSMSADFDFKCHACGDRGKHISYHCYECLVDYHLTCCLLPYTGKEIHHRHNLTITTFGDDYDHDEDFICNSCEDYRNPRCWFYRCNEGCQFECHLQCMTFEAEEDTV